MYTNQKIRWGSIICQEYSVSNGVKQVLSPLLFTIYIDNLLFRLRESGIGCYIGKYFCGAFGYADDLIVLTPTIQSQKIFLDICTKYANEFNVCFNPAKSKLIVMSKEPVVASCSPQIHFSIQGRSLDFWGGTQNINCLWLNNHWPKASARRRRRRSGMVWRGCPTPSRRFVLNWISEMLSGVI